ncbi:aminoacyl-tRNA hydrolase [Komagataeibacter nataicola]|uniref:Aminoacyl-tRNA hydrolase n=1 Tax=Komagataeibacter nataicola TaxID=265960 RepID=A0A9N7CVS2_9PROT|nr:alternative ribosome rescue aminoacyl-tRNA hydrolase ArfB [Komagataeibacter nataicola]AQU88045.1 aminoacyl-tRNA hydrolase [Komagataeibacter nataicola]PYD65056.1 aminoacyl-tRNA hydrolase [Komagataeibacter nataicola]WEQ54860.1 alternative ribosome rescue aminoacyl-tRNA hydrolase ArfB [Komagataeibacter nataicola]WNM09197.1 alternative ribosome rescue aminoacyl-tRNA hydrolase ArfB [Komagataeibacter nataicola]GBR14422.1 peptidyl-tRNA hydrolase domain protein [Komagataeibacter nataicola NRIC 0616
MSPPTIPDDELHVTYILASGPGGQNVNKVATAAQLRFDARNSPSLSTRIKSRLITVAGSRMTADGVIVLTARRFRSQIRNREDAVARLHEMIAEASHVQAYRVPTRPSRTQRRKRVDNKKHRSRIKQGRSGNHMD